MRTEPADYNLTPPELTDSEDEYDPESDTANSISAECHPSGSIASAITGSIGSCGHHPPGRINVSKMIIRDKPVSDNDVNSSDKEKERLRMHKGLNKDTFQRRRLTNLYHPPGTDSPVKRTKQYTNTSKEKGRNMVREGGPSAPDTVIDSSLTGKINQEVDWSPDTNTNSKDFHPSGTVQAAVRLKNNIEMVSKGQN